MPTLNARFSSLLPYQQDAILAAIRHSMRTHQAASDTDGYHQREARQLNDILEVLCPKHLTPASRQFDAERQQRIEALHAQMFPSQQQVAA